MKPTPHTVGDVESHAEVPAHVGDAAKIRHQAGALTRWRVGLSALIAVLGLVGPIACESSTNAPPAPSPRPLVLETVVAGHRVLAQNTDGSFTALPITPGSWLRLRIESDQPDLLISVDGADLPRRTSGAAAWADAQVTASTGSRNLFEDVAIQLPSSKLNPPSGSMRVTARYANIPTGAPDPGTLAVDLLASDPSKKAGDVFDSGENSKDDSGNPFCHYAKDDIVARNVVVAGWLFPGTGSNHDGAAPARHSPGTSTLPNSSEDFHYDIQLDDAFLKRNYGASSLLQPVASAVMPGHPTPCNLFTHPPRLPLLLNGQFDANAVTIPGSELMTVELNSWHVAARGNPPSGWVRDPDQANFSGDAWPFDPLHPLGVPRSTPLSPGDYIIVSGTLWEDSGHIVDAPSTDSHRCWDSKLQGHGGWLEIHPVDSIRRIDPPNVRRTMHLSAGCSPATAIVDEYFFGDGAPKSTSVLKWQRVDDPRFTAGGATLTEVVDPDCPIALHVHAVPAPGGYFKSLYYVWWDDSAPGPEHSLTCRRPGVSQQSLMGPQSDEGS